MSAPAPNGASAGAPQSANDARDPSGFLSEIIGAPVTVKLNSGVVYKGMHLPEDKVCLDLLTCEKRRAAVRRRLHEHRPRGHARVCGRQDEKVVWRCVCEGKQWYVQLL